MAEEVEISNVGGDGNVASEETLSRLVKAIEGYSRSSGMDPKSQVAKAQMAYSRTLKEDIKSIEEKIDAQEEYTGALRRSAGAIGGLVGGSIGLLSRGLGVLTESALGFADTMMNGDDSLSGLVSNFPIFGSLLAKATQPLDDTIQSLQELSKVGATFSYDLSDLRMSARASRMSLDEYTTFIGNNAQQMAAFGGTVTRGASAVSGLVDSLGTEMQQGLLRLGFTFEDINDEMANYLYLERSNRRLRMQSEADQAAIAAEYSKSLLVLNKLTGEDIKTIQDRIAAEQREFAFQRALSRMNDDQRANIQLLFANVAATMGPGMVEIFKAQIINEGVIPPDLAAQFSVFRGSIGEMGRAIDVAMATPEDMYGQAQLANSLTNMLTRQLQDAEAMGSLLDVGAIVGEGVPAEILRTINEMQLDPAQLLTDGIVDPTKVREIVNQAIIESVDPGDGSPMGVFAQFSAALGEAKKAIEDNLISPFLEGALIPALASFTTFMEGFTTDEGEGSKFEKAVQSMRTKLEEAFGKIQTFINDFAADPEKAIEDLKADLSATITGFFEDVIDKIIGLVEARILGFEGGSTGALQDLTGEGILNAQEISNFANAERILGTELYNRLTGHLTLMERGLTSGASANIALGQLLEKNRAEGLTEAETQIVRDVLTALGETPNFNDGTNGFANFGKGTLAMLHGREAVIPLDSPLGKLIDGISNQNSNQSAANQSSSQAIQELNNTMMHVLAVLRQTKTIDERIEKNTSSMGGNIANGRVSVIR